MELLPKVLAFLCPEEASRLAVKLLWVCVWRTVVPIGKGDISVQWPAHREASPQSEENGRCDPSIHEENHAVWNHSGSPWRSVVRLGRDQASVLGADVRYFESWRELGMACLRVIGAAPATPAMHPKAPAMQNTIPKHLPPHENCMSSRAKLMRKAPPHTAGAFSKDSA